MDIRQAVTGNWVGQPDKQHDTYKLLSIDDGSDPVQAMKGRFRSILPSDLFRAGAHAVESLPATRGADYASEVNRGELIRLMRRCVQLLHACCHDARSP